MPRIATSPAVLIVSSAAFFALAIAYLYQKKQKSIPKKWRRVGKVTQLTLYPLKSGKRIELNEAECTDFGLRMCNEDGVFPLRDRSFVVYGENNNEFKHARIYPKMVLISLTAIDKNRVALDAPGMAQMCFTVPYFEPANVSQITLWNEEKCPTVDCGDAVAKWLSQYLLEKDDGLRLGTRDEGKRREISKKFHSYYPQLLNNATGFYSDATSYLMLNQASIDDLNSKIPDSTISSLNFRPNVLIEGETKPWEEDNWQWIKIGDVVFRNVKPCTRCILTTINPATGVRDANREPLKTLETYRRLKDVLSIPLEGKSTVMGFHAGLRKAGMIHLNDPVYVEA